MLEVTARQCQWAKGVVGAGPYPELKVWGENTFLGGKIIVFVKCFNKNISGH